MVVDMELGDGLLASPLAGGLEGSEGGSFAHVQSPRITILRNQSFHFLPFPALFIQLRILGLPLPVTRKASFEILCTTTYLNKGLSIDVLTTRLFFIAEGYLNIYPFPSAVPALLPSDHYVGWAGERGAL